MALSDHPMWRKPQHHFDLEHVHDHVHWVELFYDLIHVVTIFLLGNYLSHHLNLHGLLVFSGVFITLWYAWGELSVYNSIYVSTDIWHRLIMSVMICTVMFMAAAIPAVEGKGWAYFAFAFGVNRLMMAFLYHRARRVNAGHDGATLCGEMVRNFLILAAIFAVSAFLPQPLAWQFFAFGVVLMIVHYLIPPISVLRFERFSPRMAHISERFALLTLIILGEGFFKLVVTLSEKGIYKVSPDVLVNFALGGVAMFVCCWTYFDLVGNGKPKNERMPTMIGIWMAHLTLMFCGVLIGVALAAEVKVGFFESYPYEYATIGCFGLAGYLASIWVIQWCIEPREAHRFATGRLRLFGIVMAIFTWITVPYVPSVVSNALWSTALCSQLGYALYKAVRTYSAEELSSPQQGA